MITKKSESTVKPLAWDLTSSQVFVYNNYNIVEVAATEDSPLHYTYDVDVYTRKEYQDYAMDKLAAMDVTNANSITDVQIALAEVYELILGGLA